MNNSISTNQIASGFLHYLDSIGQSQSLPEIIQLLSLYVTDRNNQVRVESAIALSNDEKSTIEQWITSNIGSQQVKYDIVPNIIGGFRLYVGDQCIDLSIAKKKKQIYAE
jgi:F0F1-type ATP synthase delta subunit